MTRHRVQAPARTRSAGRPGPQERRPPARRAPACHLARDLLLVARPAAPAERGLSGPGRHLLLFCRCGVSGHAASFHPCNDLPQVFADVHSGRCELGVVPLENSLQGTVGVSFDLFLKYDVHIQAELFSPISHCLLSHAGQPGRDHHGLLASPAPGPVRRLAAQPSAPGRPHPRGVHRRRGPHGRRQSAVRGHRQRQAGRHDRPFHPGPPHRGRARQLDALRHHRPQARGTAGQADAHRARARPYRRGQDLHALHPAGQVRCALRRALPAGRAQDQHAQAGVPPPARPVLEVRLLHGRGMRPDRPPV